MADPAFTPKDLGKLRDHIESNAIDIEGGPGDPLFSGKLVLQILDAYEAQAEELERLHQFEMDQLSSVPEPCTVHQKFEPGCFKCICKRAVESEQYKQRADAAEAKLATAKEDTTWLDWLERWLRDSKNHVLDARYPNRPALSSISGDRGIYGLFEEETLRQSIAAGMQEEAEDEAAKAAYAARAKGDSDAEV